MAEYIQEGALEAGRQSVNAVVVFSDPSVDGQGGIEYDENGYRTPTFKFIENVLEGLQILKCEAKESYKIATHPLEDGQLTSDMKIKNQTVVTVTGLCDNLRGEMTMPEGKKAENLLQWLGNKWDDLKDTLWNGTETEGGKETVITLARIVYAKLSKMLAEREFKTYTISTKGAIYQNMMLTNIDQLNDPEHLLSIPVTLTFTEAMTSNETNALVADVADVNIEMKGNAKEKGIIKEAYENISNSIVDGLDFMGISAS